MSCVLVLCGRRSDSKVELALGIIKSASQQLLEALALARDITQRCNLINLKEAVS
jgi:hypothetical protein